MSQGEQFHDEGELLVAAMTRPFMLGGFTATSIVLSVGVPCALMMVTRFIWPAALIPVFLLISYLVCLKDVYLFNIFGAASHLRSCPNKRLWGCRRYAPR